MSSDMFEIIERLNLNTFKKNKENIIYEMVYKPNENKEEKRKKMKELKKRKTFLLDDEKEYDGDVLRIFGKDFVKNNKKDVELYIKIKNMN